MGLAEHFQSAQTVRPGPDCSINLILRRLNDEDAAELRRVLDPASGFTATQILAGLMAEGISVSTQTIGRHRRGLCKCSMGAA